MKTRKYKVAWGIQQNDGRYDKYETPKIFDEQAADEMTDELADALNEAKANGSIAWWIVEVR